MLSVSATKAESEEWRRRALELEDENSKLLRKLSELQHQRDEEVASLNATISVLRGALQEAIASGSPKAQTSSSSLSPERKEGEAKASHSLGAVPSDSYSGESRGPASPSSSSVTASPRPPPSPPSATATATMSSTYPPPLSPTAASSRKKQQLSGGEGGRGSEVNPSEIMPSLHHHRSWIGTDTRTRLAALQNPNQIGTLVPSEYAPPCGEETKTNISSPTRGSGSGGGAKKSNLGLGQDISIEEAAIELESRRAANPDEWYTVSALQVAVAHYATAVLSEGVTSGGSSFSSAHNYSNLTSGEAGASPRSTSPPKFTTPVGGDEKVDSQSHNDTTSIPAKSRTSSPSSNESDEDQDEEEQGGADSTSNVPATSASSASYTAEANRHKSVGRSPSRKASPFSGRSLMGRKGRKATSKRTDTPTYNDTSYKAYIRLVGNEPVLSPAPPSGPKPRPAAPPFTSENLSPALVRHFGAGITTTSGLPRSTSTSLNPSRKNSSSQSATGAGGTADSAPPSSPSGASGEGNNASDAAGGAGCARATSRSRDPYGDPTLSYNDTPHPPQPSPAARSRGSSTIGATSTTSNSAFGRSDEITIEFLFPKTFRSISSEVAVNFDELALSAIHCPWRLAKSPGKSASNFFYFGHYVLKTVTDSEIEFAEDPFLGRYLDHIRTHRGTLLPHMIGLISVTNDKSGDSTTYLLCNNVMRTTFFVNKLYDLKGSTVGRDGTTDKGATTAHRTAAGAPLLKDNDLPTDPNLGEKLICVGPQQKAVILAQLRSDVSFLEELSVIDYSVLVGVRTRKGWMQSSPSLSSSNPQLTTGFGDAMMPSSPGAGGGPLPDQNALPQAGGSGGCSGSHFRSLSDPSELFGLGASPCSPHGSVDAGVFSIPMPSSTSDPDVMKEETYYLGLIDVLQPYSGKKKFENFAKGFLVNRHKISVVPPDEFATRLCVLMERLML